MPKVNQLRKKTKKQNLLRSNIKPVLITHSLTDEELEYETDDWLYVSYRRPEVVRSNVVDDSDLSDYVKFRLWLARQLALKKYQEMHS